MNIETNYLKQWILNFVNFWFNWILINFFIQFLYGCVVAIIFQTLDPYQVMYDNPIENIDTATFLTIGAINIIYLFSILINDNDDDACDVYPLNLNKLIKLLDYEN